MAEFKKQTNGYFDLVGMIKGFGAESFGKDLQGTNNPNWIYNRLSVMLTDGNGKNLYVNMQDGYSRVNGKTIYAQSLDDKQMTISFADRFNEGIRNALKDTSFFKVATGKVKTEMKDRNTGEVVMENGQPKMIEVWNYARFLTVYDMLTFLSDKLTDGLKVRMTGQIKYREYNGNTQREFNVQRVYFLPEGDDTPCEFKVTQQVIIDEDSIDDSKLELDGVVTLRSKIYQKKNKNEMVVIPLPLTIRFNSTDVEKNKKGIELLYRVTGDTLRRITLECVINSGYIQKEATVDSIPQELQELIEAGIYTEEDIKKSYTNKEKVDELLVIKPIVKDGKIDKDDEYYVKSDLENLQIKKEESPFYEEKPVTNTVTQTYSASIDEFDLDKELGL